MKFKNKILSILLTVVLVFSLIPSATLTAWAMTTTYNINEGSVNITKAGDYVINGNGSSTTNTILVNNGISGTINITLHNVQIDASSGSNGDGAFWLGSMVNLTISGTNTLQSAYHNAGIGLPGDVAIIITDDKTNDASILDTLTANGGASGAGIGGGCYGGGGTVIITGGIVTANGGASGAGIGGGYGSYGGYVKITGSGTSVTACGGSSGFDIGRGDGSASGGTLTVGDAGMGEAPLPAVTLSRSGTNAATTLKNCTVTNNSNAEMTGTYNAEGYIPVTVSLDTAVTGTLTAAISGYSGGYVQFSYKADGDTAFTNIGGTVSVSSGKASTNFSPATSTTAAVPGNYTIKAAYFSPNPYHQGSDTGTVTVADATLASLDISSGTLSPSFDPSKTIYTANVGYSVSDVTITPTVNEAGATVKVNGTAVASGSASDSIALIPGSSTKINIVVTAKDGVMKNNYSVTATDMTYSQAIDANSLQSLKAPTDINLYQHVYYGGTRWRILNNSGGQLFLLTDNTVTSMRYGPNSNGSGYQNSDVRTWLLGTFSNNFSLLEQSAMVPNSDCYSDKIYLLSGNDVKSITYFPGTKSGSTSVFGTSLSANTNWWTRWTTFSASTYYVTGINSSGYSQNMTLISDTEGVRPGMLLNLSSVLHASPAADGANPSVDSALSLTQQVTDNAKLTLLDSAKTLTIDSVTADSYKSGSTVTVGYSGASTGTNQYLCVNLAAGASTYRGVIKALTAGNDSGTATFTLPMDITSGKYTLRLWNEQYNAAQCTNYASAPETKNITFSIPVITHGALPGGTVGTVYQTTVNASGGTVPYTWSATGLPKGLSIDTSGNISGTPEHDGTHNLNNPYSVEITVTDFNGQTDTWDTSLKINPETVALLSATANGAENSSTSTKIELTFDKAVTGLTADNITITNGTGAAVRGSLTGSGTNWTIALTSVTTQGNVSVEAAAPTGYAMSGSPKTVAVYKGASITDAVIIPNTGSFDLYAADDVKTVVTWNDAAEITDIKAGSASIGTGSYNVTAIDSNTATLTIKKKYLETQAAGTLMLTVEFYAGNSATLTVNIADSPSSGTAPTIVTKSLDDGMVGTPYNQTPFATGDVLIAWSVASGSLPNGLTLNASTGNISGTPTISGTFGFTLKAKNSVGEDTKALSINIGMPTSSGKAPIIITSSLSGGVVGTSYSQTPFATGDVLIAWSVTSGSLPNGLTLNTSTGNISGTPTISGTFSFSLRAINSIGIDTKALSIIISPILVPVPTPKNGGGSDGIIRPIPPTITTPIIPDPSAQPAVTPSPSIPVVETNSNWVPLKTQKPTDPQPFGVSLSSTTLKLLTESKVPQYRISGGPVSLDLNLEALKEILKQSTSDVTITLSPVTKLSRKTRLLIGTRPVYNITLSYIRDGKTINISSLGDGRATLSIPYTPNKKETVGCLFGVYIDSKGNAMRISESTYNANRGGILFDSNHFSMYGVGYTAPSVKFSDTTTHWAKESIDYIISRGLFKGTSSTTFSPNKSISRGMLVTVLGKLARIDVKDYKTSSFTDVKASNTSQPYIEWAYKEGILGSVGNRQFAPNRVVTREELAVILQSYAKVTGYTLPITREATTFSDSSSINSSFKAAVTAMQQAGLMNSKSNGSFDPKGSTSRAELAVILHRYIELMIDPTTANGWVKNDSGQRLYYKDGVRVIK